MASSSDEAKKALALSIAQARNQYVVAEKVINQVMDRVKKELNDNMILLGPDGKPIVNERGIPLVPDSKIVQLVEFRKGIIQIGLVMGATNKLKEAANAGDAAASSSRESATEEVMRLTSEIDSVQTEAMQSMSEAMKIFQQVCFGGPLSEAELQELKAKMEKVGQDSVNRMLSLIATSAVTASTVSAQAGPADA